MIVANSRLVAVVIGGLGIFGTLIYAMTHDPIKVGGSVFAVALVVACLAKLATMRPV